MVISVFIIVYILNLDYSSSLVVKYDQKNDQVRRSGEIIPTIESNRVNHHCTDESDKGAEQNGMGFHSEGYLEKRLKGDKLNVSLTKNRGEIKGNERKFRKGRQRVKTRKKNSQKKKHALRSSKVGKKKKKLSKGYDEEYHKDEIKSKKGHWSYEHSNGKFVKFGNKREKDGSKKSNLSRTLGKEDPQALENWRTLYSVEWTSQTN